MNPLPLSHMPGCRKRRETQRKEHAERQGKAKTFLAAPPNTRAAERETEQAGRDRQDAEGALHREGGIQGEGSGDLEGCSEEGRVPCVP